MPSTTPGHSLLSRRALVGHSAMAGRSHRVTSGASAAALRRWGNTRRGPRLPRSPPSPSPPKPWTSGSKASTSGSSR